MEHTVQIGVGDRRRGEINLWIRYHEPDGLFGTSLERAVGNGGGVPSIVKNCIRGIMHKRAGASFLFISKIILA